LDLFESARIDQKIPIESIMETLKTLVSEGKFDHIGMSECSAATLRRAAKVATIAAVEIEISPLSYEEETKKGARYVLFRLFPDFDDLPVIAAAKELGIAVVGYSPVARGILSLKVTNLDDVEGMCFASALLLVLTDASRGRSCQALDTLPGRRMWRATLPYSLLTSELQNLAHHLKIAETLKEIGAKKGATPAQLSIAWVSALGPHVIPLPGSS
jgi:pyridoxine 4-dehydrogenase